jgi:hypothetical protein
MKIPTFLFAIFLFNFSVFSQNKKYYDAESTTSIEKSYNLFLISLDLDCLWINIANMEAMINSVGPSSVSKHFADPSQMNVFDVLQSSISDPSAFENALRDNNIYFIKENGCYHIQIPQ